MKKYEVSVVTPIHNTNLNIFTKTAQSMRDQTLGFENIEWIVVVHNSTEEYDRKIQEMFSGDENVKVEILHNDAHTPSSPRNRGLEVATGDYVGFLDGDDKYTPECLKTALTHIKNTESDVCLFRRSVELSSSTETHGMIRSCSAQLGEWQLAGSIGWSLYRNRECVSTRSWTLRRISRSS